MSRLFWKLFLSFWLAMITSLIAGILFYATFRSPQTSDGPDPLTEAMYSKADFMLDIAQNALIRKKMDDLIPLLKIWNAQLSSPHLAIYGARNEPLAGSDTSIRTGVERTITLDGVSYRMIADIPQFIPKPEKAFMVPMIIAAFVSIIFSGSLAWYLSRPLRHLRWALHSVAQGNFDTRVQPLMGSRRDEIVDLSRDIDGMTAQIQQLIQSQQRLLHDISHELRSPLTRMQVAIGLIQQNPDNACSMLERIEREAERLDTLVEALLTLARLEAGSDKISQERVDIIELLTAIAEDADFEAQAIHRRVEIHANGPFVALVKGELIYRAFENVIRNAVKYTDEGTTVEVTAVVADNGESLSVRVADQGPGVPSEALIAIFEPFQRVESNTPIVGYGLGLAIARRAIESHRGRIKASLPETGGLAIDIWLPQTMLENEENL